MFSDYESLTTLDLSNLDTSQVTDMRGMFFGCKNLSILDLSNFNTSQVISMSNMFFGCSDLTNLILGTNFYIPDKAILGDLVNFGIL